MTQLQITIGTETNGNILPPSGGTLTATPTKSRYTKHTVILPKPQTITMDAFGRFNLTLTPTELGEWCWKLDYKIPGTATYTEHVLVPETDSGTANWGDLIHVDPDTITPTSSPDPVWWGALRNGLKSAAPGPQGEPGEPGPTGEPGERGLPGLRGPQGERGNQGIQGIQGERGEQGNQGIPGERGLTGPTGPQGERGITGERGPQGERGLQGIQGTQGVKGDTGIGFTATQLGTTDLNTVTTPGIYGQSSATIVGNNGASLNYPPTIPTGARGRFTMTVQHWGGNGAVLQTINTIGTASTPGITFRRYLEPSQTPSNWSAQVSQRVDNTAGRAIYTWDDTNNREQLIYGDTGWRDVSELLTSKFVPTASTGKCQIRRVGNMVSLMLKLAPSAELVASGNNKSNTEVLMALPSGFTESPATYGLSYTGTVSAPLEIIGLGATNTTFEMRIRGTSNTSWKASEIISANMTWLAPDTWPTTLPGKAL